MDNEKPLVSVIIPVYNVEKYLDECIESVVKQCYNNLEIVIVEDGSPDNCPGMCDGWAKKDGRIKVIHKKNGGLSSARNAGLKIASGDFIAFVDSDDYIDKSFVEIMLSRIKKDGSDMAVCNYLAFGDRPREEYSSFNTMPVKDEVLTTGEILRKLVEFNHWHYVISCCKLYKRDLFDGFSYPEGRLHEDVFTSHIIFSRCKRVSCVNKALYYYRQNEGSITHSYTLKSLDIIDAYLERLDFFIKNNMQYEAALTAETVAEKILQAYDRLDMKKKDNKNVVRHYKSEYNKRYKKLFRNKYGNYRYRFLFRTGIWAVNLKRRLVKK